MIFNQSVEYLAQWCREQEEWYREQMHQGLLFVKRSFFDAMAYKLYILTDREADSFEDWRRLARKLVRHQCSDLLAKDQSPLARQVRRNRDPEALALLEEAEREYLEFLDGMTQADTADPQRYLRVLTGEEKAEVEYDVLLRWGYDTHYWYPLEGSFDDSKLFLNVQYLEGYWDRLSALIGLPQERVYECGESIFELSGCVEVDELYGYGGCECAYLPKDLSWIIYFSHEGTVTFAGSIVPAVRELLKDEREHWNQWT